MFYITIVVRSIRHKGLKAYWTKGRKGGLHPDWIARVERIMSALDAATRPEDMNYPGARFHTLSGVSRYSVRLTANHRMTFGWEGDGPVDVDI